MYSLPIALSSRQHLPQQPFSQGAHVMDITVCYIPTSILALFTACVSLFKSEADTEEPKEHKEQLPAPTDEDLDFAVATSRLHLVSHAHMYSSHVSRSRRANNTVAAYLGFGGKGVVTLRMRPRGPNCY